MAHPEVVPTGPFPTPGFPSATETPYPQSIHKAFTGPQSIQVCVCGGGVGCEQVGQSWGEP